MATTCVLTAGVQRRMSAVALLVVTVIAATTTTATVGAVPLGRRGGAGRLRVGRPCSGRIDGSVELPLTTTDVDVGVSRHLVHRSLRDISGLLNDLCDDVNRLKTNYAENRDVVDIGIHVDAMPRHTDVHVASSDSHSIDLASRVANVTSRLSRVAVFIHLLRAEESRHEPRPFDNELHDIEDHAEHGLYGILCRLHVVHRLAAALDQSSSVDDDLAAGIDAALAEVRLIEAARPAHRHVRAISIFSDFAQLLQQVIVVLDYPGA